MVQSSDPEISVMAQRRKRLRRTRLCEIVNVNGGLGLIIICILKTFFIREEPNRRCPFLNIVNVIDNMRIFV